MKRNVILATVLIIFLGFLYNGIALAGTINIRVGGDILRRPGAE
jgi:hypothetical protein